MRDKLINRIYKLAEATDLTIMEDLRHKSNDELISLFAEVVIEHYLFEDYFWEK